MNKLQKNWVEWIVFALGLILVSSTLGYLIFAGASMGHEPPSLEFAWELRNNVSSISLCPSL